MTDQATFPATLRELTAEELQLVAGGWAQSSQDLYGGDIYVTAWGYDTDSSWFGTGDEDYPDGSGGGGDNPYEFTFANDDAPCKQGAALKIGNHLHGLESTIGKYEFGALIVQNADGTYGALDNGINTSYSAHMARLTPPEGTDYSQILGIVQNQPYDTSLSGFNSNYLNRYPSDGDWMALETLAEYGADAARLSIFITDPWGTTREFKLSDKALYQAMNDSQRLQGGNLPPETVPCGS
jgi:hypothetical protein